MTAKLIDGKAFAASLRARVQDATATLKKRHGLTVGLTVVLVGNDPASEIYVRLKVDDAKEAGIESRDIKLPATASEAEVLDVVRRMLEVTRRKPALTGRAEKGTVVWLTGRSGEAVRAVRKE